jgi:hypothetical protein
VLGPSGIDHELGVELRAVVERHAVLPHLPCGGVHEARPRRPAQTLTHDLVQARARDGAVLIVQAPPVTRKEHIVSRPAFYDQRIEPRASRFGHIMSVKTPGMIAAEHGLALDHGEPCVRALLEQGQHDQCVLEAPSDEHVLVTSHDRRRNGVQSQAD